MSDPGNARILDLRTIEHFKTVLVGFGDSLRSASMEAESEIGRTINWLEGEVIQHWRVQIRKRQDLVTMARSELYRKQMQGSEKDGRPSVVDEKKQLDRAVRALESAQRKLEVTRKWRNRLEREYALFKGQTSGLGTIAERQVPAAVARLDRMLLELEAYVSERSGTQADLGELLARESPDSVARRGTDPSADTDDEQEDGDEDGPDRDPTVDGGGS
ncbi:MAG: hypothetical protein VXY94_07940 [Planctomycetota bacterium]|nr:hypothetical protein [Planctomycetota bacterium]MEC9156545.1 hypothetical protein [Planctomycetota bacterium]MEC9232382.1 hypothetical protein [Planctomycetota bacterium]